MSETYKEKVNRWRILRHDDLPEAHKAEYRLSGINPDDLWSLIWSFEDEDTAVEMLDKLNRRTSRDWSRWTAADWQPLENELKELSL